MRAALLIFLLTSTLAAAADPAKSLVLARLQETETGELQAMLEYYLQSPLQPRLSAEAEELMDAFVHNEIAMAWVDSLTYVRLKRRAPAAEPVFRLRDAQGRDTYQCVIAAFDTTSGNLRQLPFYSLAVPLAPPCDRVNTALLLRSAGLSLARMNYHLKSDERDAALDIVLGRYQSASLRQSTLDDFAHLGLKRVLSGPVIPSPVLVINPATLPAATTDRLHELLTAEDAELASFNAWRQRLVAASDSDYEQLRKMLPDRGP